MSGRLARLPKILSHPLMLLVAGAMVTSLAVPAITRGWQDHEKALAVKSALVEDIAAKSSRFLAAIQFARVSPGDENGTAVNAAYGNFLVDGDVLGARLSARFRDGTIAARWRAFTRLVEQLYALGEEGDERVLGERARAILDGYQRSAEPLSAVAEAERKRLVREFGNTPAQRSWLALLGEILGQRDALVRAILDADEVEI